MNQHTHHRLCRLFVGVLVTALLLVLVNATPCSAQTGVDVPELHLFDTKMNQILTTYGIVGGQLAITYQGRLVYDRGFGLADTTTKELVQPTSIFRIASASKTITSTTVMHLVEQHRITLDGVVLGASGILHDQRFAAAIDPRMYEITIRQLLTHSSGLGFAFADDPLWNSYDIAIALGIPPPDSSFDDMLEWTTKNRMLSSDPGTKAFYSNFGYVLLGRVIEQVVGMPYETYVRDSILAPLSIANMHAGRTLKANKYPDEVCYYEYAQAPLSTSIYTGIPNSVPAPYGGYHWEVMTPAGGWVASAQDLCKFLCGVDGLASRPDILQPSTLDSVLQPSTAWPAYGLGWFVSSNEHSHTGGIQGSASVVVSNNELAVNYAIIFNTLPENYTPFYNAFIHLVTDEYQNISSWPTHDLFKGTTDVKESSVRTEVKVYPNPTTGTVTLLGVGGEATITNSVGVVVWHGIVDSTVPLNLAHYPSGIYWLRVGQRTTLISLIK